MSVRGMFTWRSQLHAVVADKLIRVNGDGSRTTLATLNSVAGRVDMDGSAVELAICDGSRLYAWNGTSLTVAAGFPGGSRIAFVDQRLVFNKRSSQQFGWSALGAATAIDPLDFASAEAVPDNIVACVVEHGDLWLFGEDGTEIWRSTGDEDVFARFRGSYVEQGCAAPFTAQKTAKGSVAWLSRSKEGQAMVMLSQGHGARTISHPGIEQKLRGKFLQNSYAYTIQEGSNDFYCLNVAGVDTTLVYDVTYDQWHERGMWRDGVWSQWLPNCHAFAYGEHFYGTDSGKIFKSEHDRHDFGGEPIVRSRVTPIIGKGDGKRMTFGELHMVCERATSGVVMLRFKDDPQDGWSNWRYIPTGEVGEYATQITSRRLGTSTGSNGRVFEFRFTDDAPFNPVSANVEIL